MNNYVVLDNFKYMVKSPEFEPVTVKPATARYLLSSAVDVSYGPGSYREWRGPIIAPINVTDNSWGTIEDLRVTLAKTQSVPFTDHYGDQYNVHLFGEIAEKSLGSVWDSPSNVIYVPVRIVAE